MAREIVTAVEVEAGADHTWRVLTTFEEWPTWHPSMLEFEGSAAAGNRLRFRARSPEGGGAVTIRPRVLEADPGRLLRWRGHFLVPGLFDATHEFALEPTSRGTRVTQRERFTGILVPLMRGVLARTQRDNARADSALKARAEALYA